MLNKLVIIVFIVALLLGFTIGTTVGTYQTTKWIVKKGMSFLDVEFNITADDLIAVMTKYEHEINKLYP